MRRLMLILLAALLFGANTFADEGVAAESQKAAASAGAHSELAAAAEPTTKIPHNTLFDQLVGTWDVRYELFDKDGKVRRDRGQVRYSWILNGKALQEIWSYDSENKDLQRHQDLAYCPCHLDVASLLCFLQALIS